MARVFVDTSGIYALIDRDDGNHASARAALDRMRKRRDEPVLTNVILAESHALLMVRLGHAMARRWLSTQAWAVERVTAEDEAAARDIIVTHTDKSYSYTDASSFAVIKRLKIRAALAFDRHFAQFGIDRP